MLTEIDVIVFILSASVWLGPFVYNLFAGRGMRLIHPIGWLPLNVVWHLIPPLFFRWLGRPLTVTARTWASDDWFLGVPMLIVTLTGLFYFLGVYVSGTPLKLTSRDRVEPYASFRVIRSCHPLVMFFLCCMFLFGISCSIYLSPKESTSQGFYWMQMLFFALYPLSVVMLNQDRRLGTIFLLLCFPSALLLVSKGAFLFFLIHLVLYYQGRIMRMSKVISFVLVLSVLLTPYAVWLYTKGGFTADMDRVEATSWEKTGMALVHRELAFEVFAIVYHRTTQLVPPTGGRRIIGELQDMIPALVWPDKPNRPYGFAHEFLTNDYPVLFSRFLLTSFLLDCGIPGCCGIMFVVGLLYGILYRKSVSLSLSKNESWPLIVYFVAYFHARTLLNGGLRMAIPLMVSVIAVVAALFTSSYLLTPSRAARATRRIRKGPV